MQILVLPHCCALIEDVVGYFFLMVANYLKCSCIAFKVNNSLNHSKPEVSTIFSVVFFTLFSLSSNDLQHVKYLNGMYVTSIVCRSV